MLASGRFSDKEEANSDMSTILSGAGGAGFYNMLIMISEAEKGAEHSAARLASGMRINQASDDPAGLVISESLRQQISGVTQAIRNTTDAINVAGTADGGLAEAQRLVQNIRSTAVRAANAATTDPAAAQAYSMEIQYSLQALDNLAETTQFGDTNLLDGSYTGQQVQLGPNAGQTVTMDLPNVSAESLGLGGIDVASAEGAAAAIAAADAASNTVSRARAELGSLTKNTLMSNVNSLSVARQNLAATESQIRDTDIALEVANLTKFQILKESGLAMLAHNAESKGSLLDLLSGK